MKEQLISFETAKLAKEKGFLRDIEVFECPYFYFTRNQMSDKLRCKSTQTEHLYQKDISFYNDSVDKRHLYPFYFEAPTQSLLQKWLREQHSILVHAMPTLSNKDWYTTFDTLIGDYEEVLEVGLFKGLKMIKT